MHKQIAEVKAADCRRANIKQFHDAEIKFPMPHKLTRPPKAHKSLFLAKRPHTFH